MNSRRNVVPIVLVLALGLGVGFGAWSCSSSGESSQGYPTPAPAPTPAPTPAPGPVGVQGTAVVPLVTNQANPDIVNAWGLAFNGAAGPAWIADNGTGKSSVYDVNSALLLTVTVPGAAGSPRSKPTGIVFNPNAALFKGDAFLFVSEDGSISGWQQASGQTGTLRVDNSGAGAVYKGGTVATVGGAGRLYAANFNAGTVEAYDQNYARVTLDPGAFTDTNLPAGYAPFNVKTIGNEVLVSYALQDPTKQVDVPGPGNGVLDAYDQTGKFVARLVSNGAQLNAPWGMTVTPAAFGQIPNRLLVGNFGDGTVNVYSLDPTGVTATYEGKLIDANQNPIVIDGLWSLEFPGNIGGFDPNQLYYTAGPVGETGGAYGRINRL